MGDPRRQPPRTLWLVRHAKALADPPFGGTDHERPLSPRGRRDAAALGRRLGPDGDHFGLAADAPTAALSSTASRAAQTAEGVVLKGGRSVAVAPSRSLYGAEPSEILTELHTVDDADRAVLVVGHNPGVHELAVALADSGPSAALRRLASDGFPTCAARSHPAGRPSLGGC